MRKRLSVGSMVVFGGRGVCVRAHARGPYKSIHQSPTHPIHVPEALHPAAHVALVRVAHGNDLQALFPQGIRVAQLDSFIDEEGA